jgi:hypothetical protein
MGKINQMSEKMICFGKEEWLPLHLVFFKLELELDHFLCTGIFSRTKK